MEFLYVFMGGGLGSLCRYAIARSLVHYHLTFPLATVVANILACLTLGLLIGWGMHHSGNKSLLLFGTVGFCGGFSTFSTFSLENYELWQSGNHGWLLLNIGASIVICFVCIAIGIKITQ